MKSWLKGGGLVTHRCNFKCGHCVYACSSASNSRYVEQNQIDEFLKFKEIFNFEFCLTGGEATLDLQACIQIIRKAYAEGCYVGMVTNSSWAEDDATTEKVIDRLHEAGLRELALSFDGYHSENDPELFGKVQRVIQVALRKGIKVAVRHCDTDGDNLQTLIQATKLALETGKLAERVPWSDIAPFGHAKKMFKNIEVSLDQISDNICSNVQSPALNTDGTVLGCCGPAFWAKKSSALKYQIDELGEKLSDPVLNGILGYGPKKLTEMLPENLQERVMAKVRYPNPCSLCVALCNDQEVVDFLRTELEKDRDLELQVAQQQISSGAVKTDTLEKIGKGFIWNRFEDGEVIAISQDDEAWILDPQEASNWTNGVDPTGDLREIRLL